MTIAALRPALVLSILIFLSKVAQADPIPVISLPLGELGPVIKQVADGLYDAYQTMAHLRGNAEKIMRGEPPDAKSRTLQEIVDNLRQESSAIKNAALPTTFDSSRYIVSLAELTKCATRANSMSKLNNGPVTSRWMFGLGHATIESRRS